MRTCLLLLFAVGTVAAPAVYDFVLKGGHVIDPKNHVSAIREQAQGDNQRAAEACRTALRLQA
ncbi:MAG: hypothetical protein ACKV22_03070 [Bryobacteraceae bacterium]